MANREVVAADKTLGVRRSQSCQRRCHKGGPEHGRKIQRKPWFAVYVEDPKTLRLPEADRNRAIFNLRLAEQLGAETITLKGRRIAEEIVNFARQRAGHQDCRGQNLPVPAGRLFSQENPVDELMRQSGGIHVYAGTGEPAEPKEPACPGSTETYAVARLRNGPLIPYPGYRPGVFDVSFTSISPISLWCICWE